MQPRLKKRSRLGAIHACFNYRNKIHIEKCFIGEIFKFRQLLSTCNGIESFDTIYIIRPANYSAVFQFGLLPEYAN